MERNSANERGKQVGVAFTSALLVVFYPILFMYLNNVSRVNLEDITRLLMLFCLHAAGVFMAGFVLMKNAIKSGTFTVVVMLCVMLFGLIERLAVSFFPMLYYWHIVMLVLTGLVLAFFFIKRIASEELLLIINKTVMIVLASLIGVNFVSAADDLIDKTRYTPDKRTINHEEGAFQSYSNVYLFIFDEYGGYDNLLEYCNYDSSEFNADLEKMGFNVAFHSMNETISTNIEVPNLLNLDRVSNEEMPHEIRMEALKAPYIIDFFKNMGYTINLLNDRGFIPLDDRYEYTLETGIFEEDTIERLIINNTIYYPLGQPKSDRKAEVDSMFSYLGNSWRIQSERLFTLSYMVFPHLPWVVDEYGNRINYSDRNNWENTDIYLGQLRYASKKILEVADAIIAADPDAIIILQSDHGFRLPYHLVEWYDYDYQYLDLEADYQRNILNAVYFHGEVRDIESLSGLDTLYLIFNEEFGTNFQLERQAE